MIQRIVLGVLIAFFPTAAWAQTQEKYLPAKSQLYFRFDGMKMHQAAFDKTALGKMMKDETGVFLEELWKYAQEQILNAAQNEPKIGPLVKDFGKLIFSMHQHGLVFGVEVGQINPPVVQAVIVFPKAAGESGTLMPLIQKIAEETKADVKSVKVGKRFVNTVNVEFLQIGWWAQGDDAVLFLGTTEPVAFAKDIDASKVGLASNPLYLKTASFKEFTTASRGYFDLTSVLQVGAEFAPPAGRVIDDLGLKGLKHITFYSGFDGPAERSIVDIDMSGPRKGLLAFTSQKKISLKDLPVLPNDITGFSASSVTLNKTYNILTNVADDIIRAFDPNQADNVKETIKAFEGAIGVDLDKELFGSLGDVMVSYSSPSDGFLGSGNVTAIQVKDGKKLAASIEKLAKAAPANPLGEVEFKRKPYRGGEIMQLQVTGKVNVQIATFGLYKNWLIISGYPFIAGYPQPIKGFILRQEGQLPAWKPDATVTKALAQFPSEFNSISVSDPRPTAQLLLSLAPPIMSVINSVGGPFVPGFKTFDLDVIPHAQYATKHLFPNVTIGIDDGKRIRTDTRASLSLPF
jgi:hypothetical protein